MQNFSVKDIHGRQKSFYLGFIHIQAFKITNWMSIIFEIERKSQ